ncbi:MAG: SUMF1/EgtB/PvdO family nonheme iron enzyme [Hyphomicrobiales bacterium]|uniref:SUMF1/EgtB/PvdO family nonheme iron enzyme n=1 Tax=Roseibium polysiphoniae TaxID=2571221 RepID=UPI0032981FA2
MIHSAVKSAIARVEDKSGSHKGQAVVIGPGLAVTCAHVVAAALGKPSDVPIAQMPETPVSLRFPNFDRAETTGRVIAWRPFDPDLSPGSDLALLDVSGLPGKGPEPVPLEPHFTDLPQQFEVVLLEYGAVDPCGDVRFGDWVSTGDTMLQMRGERFVEEGVSGTGVTFPFPGRGLIGLAAGRPTKPGPDAHGYVIPAKHIAALLEDRASEIAKGCSTVDADPPLRELKFLVEQLRGGTRKLQTFNGTQQIADCVEGALGLVELDLETGLTNGLLSTVGTLSKTLEDTVRDCDGVVLRGQGPDGSDVAAVDAFGPYRISRIAGLLADLEKDERRTPRGLINNDVMDETSAYTTTRKIRDEILTEIQTLKEGEENTLAPTRALTRLDVRLRPKQIDPVDIRRSQMEISALPDRFTRGPGLVSILTAVQIFIGKHIDLADDLTSFRDQHSDGTPGPEMIIIPACPDGFLMGSPEDEPEHVDNEKQHLVTIRQRFAVGRNAVTFNEYVRYCEAAGIEVPDDDSWGRHKRPVINVSWTDVQGYVAWLNRETDGDAEGRYRLPSEAEWEYACRSDQSGKNTTPFSPSVGLTSSPAGTFLTSDEANFNGGLSYNGSPKGDNRKKTVTVDQEGFCPNAFGLWHMHGNVWEWCQDHYEKDYEKVPADGTPHETRNGSSHRVLRGGSQLSFPRNLRSAIRFRNSPEERFNVIGFRLSRTLTS